MLSHAAARSLGVAGLAFGVVATLSALLPAPVRGEDPPAGEPPAPVFGVVPVTVPAKGDRPERTVWVDGVEVTAGLYALCVQAEICDPEWHSEGTPTGPCNYGPAQRAQHPMNCVSWHGADAYCRWVGGRLCQEDEWFSACRGPDDRDYPYGDDFEPGFCNAAPGQGSGGTHPVGSDLQCTGAWTGMMDMAGNVSEWVDSCNGNYCHFYGGAYRVNDPVDYFASCKRFCAGNQKELKSATIGFRCCRDTL